MNNTIEGLTIEEEKEVQTYLEELEGVKKDNPAKKDKVELKTLPEHLMYVFIGENETNPVIISSSLRKEEEAQLVKVLKKHKAAIG